MVFGPRGGYPPEGQRPQQRGPMGAGIGMRIIIALVLALVGLFMYWNQQQVNPVTGEKQHVALSPDQEIKLGLESAPQMSREMGGEMPASDPRTLEVQKIGQKLVDNTDAIKSPWKFKFHLLADTQTVNAFALPGGQIFITRGLYDKLENEAELAGVLAHEMGHVIERHSAQQMAKSQLGNMLVVAFGTAASDPQSQNNQAVMIAGMVNQMIQLRYGRKDESQADIWGIKLMEQVGYNPTAMIKVMEVLKSVGGSARGQTPEIFQSHPNPDLRIEQIKAYLKENPPPPGLTMGKSLKDIYKGSPRGTQEDQADDPLQQLFELFKH